MYTTHQRWWTVTEASRLLRVSTDALYDACKSGQFPHTRLYDNGPIRIPCEALRMKWVPEPAVERILSRSDSPSNCGWTTDPQQLELPLDLSALIPVRRYRNTGEPIQRLDYERQLWRM